MEFLTHPCAQLGHVYTSSQIDSLFAVSGHAPIRTNFDNHVLVLVNDSALDINADQWGAGYIRFAGLPEAIGVQASDSLNQILEASPENGMALELFTKSGFDQYTYLGHATRCDFKDGSRHQWAHVRQDHQEADVMVFLVQPETCPTQAAREIQSLHAEVSVSPWQDQESIPLGEEAAEEAFWEAAEEEYMEDLLHDAIWPFNEPDAAFAALWQRPIPDVPMEQKGNQPMEMMQETPRYTDAASAARYVEAMVEDHLLKKDDTPIAAVFEEEQEEAVHDPFWGLWQH